jgi:BASS family bile acid:Na+ symporter
MLEFYLSNEYWFAATQLILAMFGMGATLTPKDFKDVFVEPLAVTSGTVIQLAAVPLATFVFLSAFDINAGVAVGIALIAAIPGGTASNIFTFLHEVMQPCQSLSQPLQHCCAY